MSVARSARWLAGAAVAVPVLGLPLLGRALAGRGLDSVFAFPPPRTIPADYQRFSWWAVAAVVGALGIVVAAWMHGSRLDAARPEWEPFPREARSGFPWWGWIGGGWTAGWWWLAWTRWPWFAPWQTFTFFPLWLGFIVTVNALTQRRRGSCLLTRSPGRWLGLFATSAFFWWGFEWLNRFVQNWHYLGVEHFGPVGYAWNATLCFSTVLPAVAAVAEWLDTHAGWRRRVATGPAWRWWERRRVAVALWSAGALALVLTGMFPRGFYPALWSAPLLLAAGAGALAGGDGVWSDVARGRWGEAITWMAAALVCGFFWEMWNVHSAAKWIYTVPGVERWRIFEMPLLGYSGYLPFGLECLLAGKLVLGQAGVRALHHAMP